METIWDGYRYYTGNNDRAYKMNLVTGATFEITDEELLARKKNYQLFCQRKPFLAVCVNGKWQLMTAGQFISTYGDMATQPPAYFSFQTEKEAGEFIAGQEK